MYSYEVLKRSYGVHKAIVCQPYHKGFVGAFVEILDMSNTMLRTLRTLRF